MGAFVWANSIFCPRTRVVDLLGPVLRVSPRHHIVGVATQFSNPGNESWRSDG